MIFCVYKDDGPKGPCGQDCYTTSKHNELLIFRNNEKFREFEQQVLEGGGRKNGRITDVWDTEINCPGNSVRYQSRDLRYMEVRLVDSYSGLTLK